jgi:23S rRNA (uridine2552-2'-O)-methyltransferase
MRPTYAILKKSASSNRWLARQSSDPYVKQRFTSPNNGSNASAALGAQYRSRASHKLLEICQRFPKLLSRGSTVVDLGCAPGSWTQVAAERIGNRGLVVGVDLLPVRPFAESDEGTKLATIKIIQGDFLDPRVGNQVRSVLESSIPTARRRVQVDTVLSDMMSNTTGVRIRDIESSLELCEAALTFGKGILKT